LKTTDALDALYKRGCSSVEFIAAGKPAEEAAIKLQSSLRENDPRRDLLVSTMKAYQEASLVIARREQRVEDGSKGPPDALMVIAAVRKVMLLKILQGGMSEEDRKLYYEWRKGVLNQ